MTPENEKMTTDVLQPPATPTTIIDDVSARQPSMTVKQVAEHLECSDQMIRKMIRENALPHYRVGKNIRVLRSSLEQWIADAEAAAAVGESGEVGHVRS